MGSEGVGGQGNPLGQLLQGLGGGTGSGGLGGLAEMAQGMFGQAKGSVQSGNPLAIGGLAALAGALLGGGGGATRGAIGGGALALLGTLAMQALRSRQQQSTPTDATALAREAPLGLREPQNASEEQELEQRALLIVRAMINAAKADGQIDGQEVARISAKLGDAGSDEEARAFLVEEMQKPIRQRRHRARRRRARSLRSRSMPRRSSQSRSTPRPSELICATSPRAWAWTPARWPGSTRRWESPRPSDRPL